MTFGDKCATDCREQTGAIAARSSRASSGRRSLLERPEVSKEYLSMLKRRCRRVKISENSRCGGIGKNVQCNMFNANMFNAIRWSPYRRDGSKRATAELVNVVNTTKTVEIVQQNPTIRRLEGESVRQVRSKHEQTAQHGTTSVRCHGKATCHRGRPCR